MSWEKKQVLSRSKSFCFLYCLLYLQQVLEGVVVLVEPRVPDGHDEVEEGLEPRVLAGRALLHPQDVVAVRPSDRSYNRNHSHM